MTSLHFLSPTQLLLLAATSGASVTSQGHLRHRNSAAASRVVKRTTSLGLLSS